MPRKKVALGTEKPFPVLNLPPEIRNRIWRYVVVRGGYVKIRPDEYEEHQELIKMLTPSRLRSGRELQHHHEDDQRRYKPMPLALALASRQLYIEAALIYYSKNTFDFAVDGLVATLQKFAAAIGTQNASSITTARFETPSPSLFQYLSVLPGLQKISISSCNFRYMPEERKKAWVLKMNAYAQRNPSVVINGPSMK